MCLAVRFIWMAVGEEERRRVRYRTLKIVCDFCKSALRIFFCPKENRMVLGCVYIGGRGEMGYHSEDING